MTKDINDDDDDLIFEDEQNAKPDLQNAVQHLVKGLQFDEGSDFQKPSSSSSNHQHPIQKDKKTTFNKSHIELIEPIQMNEKIIFGKSNELTIKLTTKPPENHLASFTKPKKETSSNKEIHQSKSNLKEHEQDDPELSAAAHQSKQEAKALQQRLEAISSTTTSHTKIYKEEIDQSQHKSNASSWSIEPEPI